jgi:Holliday junction DNA helicase RuvA
VIAFLEGEIAEKTGTRVVVSVGGVGYDVLVPASTGGKLPPVGGAARLYTRMHVRDDSVMLYGFATQDERGLFDLLVTVTGVGPKVALSFLSVLAPEALRRAVASGDIAALTMVPGVGKKVAQRVLVDLRDKLGGEGATFGGSLADVREALVALGLSAQEASQAMAGLAQQGQSERPVEELLREALRNVGRG